MVKYIKSGPDANGYMTDEEIEQYKKERDAASGKKLPRRFEYYDGLNHKEYILDESYRGWGIYQYRTPSGYYGAQDYYISNGSQKYDMDGKSYAYMYDYIDEIEDKKLK